MNLLSTKIFVMVAYHENRPIVRLWTALQRRSCVSLFQFTRLKWPRNVNQFLLTCQTRFRLSDILDRQRPREDIVARDHSRWSRNHDRPRSETSRRSSAKSKGQMYRQAKERGGRKAAADKDIGGQRTKATTLLWPLPFPGPIVLQLVSCSQTVRMVSRCSPSRFH